MSAIRRGEKHARAYEQCGDDEENFMKKIIAVMIVGLLATPGIAQMQGMDHSKMDMGQMMKPTPANPYPSAEMEMHQKMTSAMRSEEHTSELQSLMRISYAVFCLKTKKHKQKVRSNTDMTTY